MCLLGGFSQCMGAPPHVKVITEKAGNASLLGWAVGDVYAWIFPVPKTPCIFFFSFKLRKKRCFHSPDSLTASPCLEGEVVSCPYPKRGHQGCLRVAFSSSSCADGGGRCSFADLTERKVFFLQLRPQQEDRTQRQGKQVPTSLLSAPLCEVGHWAKPIPALMHGVMGLRSPLLVQRHQNISFLRGGQTFSKENIFAFVKKTHKTSLMFQWCYFSWANSYFKNRTLKENLQNN